MQIERVSVTVFDLRVTPGQFVGHAGLPLNGGPLARTGALADTGLHRQIIAHAPVIAADRTRFRFTGSAQGGGHFWRRVAAWALAETAVPLHGVLPVAVTPPRADAPIGRVWLWPFGGAGELHGERTGPMTLQEAVAAAAELTAAMPGRALGALWREAETRLWPEGGEPQGSRAEQRMMIVGLVASPSAEVPRFLAGQMDREGWSDVDKAAAYSLLFGKKIAIDEIGLHASRATHAPFAADSFALAGFDPPRALVFLTQRHREPGPWTRCCITNVAHCLMLAHALAHARRHIVAVGAQAKEAVTYRAAGAALAALPALYTRQFCPMLLQGSSLLRTQMEPLTG